MKCSGALKFADNLREQLQSRRISEENFAHKVGMSSNTISRYLHGFSEPSLTKIGIMARALEIDYRVLLKDIETEEL